MQHGVARKNKQIAKMFDKPVLPNRTATLKLTKYGFNQVHLLDLHIAPITENHPPNPHIVGGVLGLSTPRSPFLQQKSIIKWAHLDFKPYLELLGMYVLSLPYRHVPPCQPHHHYSSTTRHHPGPQVSRKVFCGEWDPADIWHAK